MQIIAMRLNDVRHKTKVIDVVLPKYLAAWGQKGMVGPDGLFKDMWLVKQDYTLPAVDPGFSAWSGAFMNSWNSNFVRKCYDNQALGFVTTIDGETRIQPPVVGNAYRKLVREDASGSLQPRELLTRALEDAKSTAAEERAAKSPDKPLSLFNKPILGYVAQWLSELGRPECQGLLEFADNNLNPTWEDGGLFYPRNDEPMDANLQWTHVDPFSGNAAIAYARLNVEDGTKKWWDEPWTRDDVRARPWVDGVTLADGVDFLRGVWDVEENVVVVTMRAWDGSAKTVGPVFKDLAAGEWAVYVDDELRATHAVQHDGGEISTTFVVGGDDVSIVLKKCA
jgi:hypothetical protein